MKELLMKIYLPAALLVGIFGVNEAFGASCIWITSPCGFEVTTVGCSGYKCTTCYGYIPRCCRLESGPCYPENYEGYFQYCHMNCMTE